MWKFKSRKRSTIGKMLSKLLGEKERGPNGGFHVLLSIMVCY